MKSPTALLISATILAWFMAGPALAQNEDKPPRYSANAVEPTHKHYAYGPDPMQFFNFWKAKSDKPTPVLVMIHGGGWHGGAADEKTERTFLDRGISVASIEYRRLPAVKIPVPILDAARAIQTIRSKADEWGLDKTRFVFRGGSAGACTSLWLALHDDLADPGSSDPIARESTKPAGVFVTNAQTCIDPMTLREWTGSDTVLNHGMIREALGYMTVEEMLRNYEKDKAVYREYSPIFHVDAKDPPVFLSAKGRAALPPANASLAIHHPIYSVKLKEKMDAAGVQCLLDAEGHEAPMSPAAFILEKLTGGQP